MSRPHWASISRSSTRARPAWWRACTWWVRTHSTTGGATTATSTSSPSRPSRRPTRTRRTCCTAHALLAEHQPRPFIDGPYVAWGDLITPPMALHRPWSLEGRLHHDGDCFELNPVTWYVLATHGVTVRGPIGRSSRHLRRRRRPGAVRRRQPRVVLGAARRRCPRQRAKPIRHTPSHRTASSGALSAHCASITPHSGEVSCRSAGRASTDSRSLRRRFAPVLHEALAVRAGTSALTAVDSHTMLLTADLIQWCTTAAAEAAAPGV